MRFDISELLVNIVKVFSVLIFLVENLFLDQLSREKRKLSYVLHNTFTNASLHKLPNVLFVSIILHQLNLRLIAILEVVSGRHASYRLKLRLTNL